MQKGDNLSRNGSGCNDHTALKAIRNADKHAKRDKKSENGGGKAYDRPYSADEARFYRFLKTVFAMADLAGYHIENRIVVREVETGKKFE